MRKDDVGTTIDAKPLAKNWKSVREPLGILLAHNFLISDYTLLVEGPAEPVKTMPAQTISQGMN